MKNSHWIILVVLLAVLGLVFFTSRHQRQEELHMEQDSMDGMHDEEMNMDNSKDTTVDTEVSVGVDLGGKVKEFTVIGDNFAFAPKMMTVNKGDTVKIVFKNTEGFHDFVLDEFNVQSRKDQGPFEDTITFVADKSGTFEYYCSVGTHRQMGMVGTLIVK